MKNPYQRDKNLTAALKSSTIFWRLLLDFLCDGDLLATAPDPVQDAFIEALKSAGQTVQDSMPPCEHPDCDCNIGLDAERTPAELLSVAGPALKDACISAEAFLALILKWLDEGVLIPDADAHVRKEFEAGLEIAGGKCAYAIAISEGLDPTKTTLPRKKD